MRIGIVGLGIVGKANSKGFKLKNIKFYVMILS